MRRLPGPPSKIATEIDKLLAKASEWETVAMYDYVGRELLSQLCPMLDEKLVTQMAHQGKATLQLSNALADYRDARFEDL